MQPLAGVHIGSCIDHAAYDVSLYHEMWHGPYDTSAIVDGAFALVFVSGLQKDFDRMRQLSYHFRRAGARVVAGGNICTMFPEFAAQFFDAVCVGGVEAVFDVMRDVEAGALQPIYRARPRAKGAFPVAYHLLAEARIDVPFHLVEASRGCSFSCSFCVMPAENNRFVPYGIGSVRDAIDRAIDESPAASLRRRWPMIWFMDNNFSDDKAYLQQLCADLLANPRVKAWGALITQNVLRDRELIATMARSKCKALFVGIESFDREFLKTFRKKQNLSRTQSVVDDLIFAERQGIVMVYPQLIDPRTASLDNVRADLRAIARDGRLPLPAFISYISPLAGTEFFWECIDRDELRPCLRLRELDGAAIAFRQTREPVETMVELAHLVFTDAGRLVPRHLIVTNTIRRMIRARRLSPWLWLLTFGASLRMMQKAARNDRSTRRTYLGGEDRLDPQYHDYPADIAAADFARYFEPVVVTDAGGGLAAWLEPYRPRAAAERAEPALAGR
ncbi:MAG: B12-binding domain-containing radical SAM protein [Janthinobacterium lividum]